MGNFQDFQNDVKSIGYMWAEDKVFFSQLTDGYCAVYRPRYPYQSDRDMIIKSVGQDGAYVPGNYVLTRSKEGKIGSDHFNGLDTLRAFFANWQALLDSINVEIVSFEETTDAVYGDTLVQYRLGDVVSFEFSPVDIRDARKEPQVLVEDLKLQLCFEKDWHGEIVRPLWSDLSDNMLDVVLNNPFDMQFFDFDHPDWNDEKSDELWEESCRLGLNSVVTCGEDGCFVTVYAGAMGSIDWKGHPEYGVACLEYKAQEMGPLAGVIEDAVRRSCASEGKGLSQWTMDI